jgi:hypothetical protein
MKGYRTILANVLFAVVPVLSLTEWMSVIPASYLPYWMLFVAVANVLLRAITTTPVGQGK